MMGLLRKILVGFLLCALLVGGWFAFVRWMPEPLEAAWIEGIYARKEAALATRTGPRVVLIGGSGTHYALRAEVVSRASGLQVVNLGTHAGLGGDYLLARARSSLRPGDTVVLALEHQLLLKAPVSSVLSTFVAVADLGYLPKAPARDVLPLVFGYPPLQVLRESAAAKAAQAARFYRADSVDRFGDETANARANKLPYMRDVVHRLPPLGSLEATPEHPPRYLVEFTQWARAHDIRLLHAWPTTTYRPIYDSPRYRQYFAAFARTFEGLGYRTLGQVQDYFLPEDEMFDSMYHADEVGAKRVSERVARDCAQWSIAPVRFSRRQAGPEPRPGP